MTGVLHWESLVGSLAQNLAAVPETTNLCSPERRGDLFQSEPVIRACRLSGSYFVGALSARTDDFGKRSGTGI